MKRTNGFRVVISLVVLLAASLACDVPGTTSKVAGNLGATETMQALATSVAGTLEPASMGEEESSENAPPAEPSEDESAGSSPSPTVSATPTLGVPMVSVSADTNCRFGPGEVYDYLGALLVGEEAPVLGKLADESFWYIENPDAPPPYCWIWGMYASISGDKSGIPILTPPPTPTPANSPTPTNTPSPTPIPMDFTASYHDYLFDCSTLFVRIKNVGNADLESFSMTVHVPQTGETLSINKNFFAGTPQCGYVHVGDITPGSYRYAFASGLQNHNGLTTFEVTIRVCTENGLGGSCKEIYFEKTIDFWV